MSVTHIYRVDNIDIYRTPYGIVNIYANDCINDWTFSKNSYWDDEDTEKIIKEYLDPSKNILEIGAHCGTSTLIYASKLNDGCRIYSFEPQKQLYNLLCKNISVNNLESKIIPFNKGVFCKSDGIAMNSDVLDCGYGKPLELYDNTNIQCNFGGTCIGLDGEKIETVTLDDDLIELENIGFIHCDAQGSEPFIFSKGKEFIKKHRPVIRFENAKLGGKYLEDNIIKSYPELKEESKFDIQDFCLTELHYSKSFNMGIDTVLVP